jgi:hypothetical protein
MSDFARMVLLIVGAALSIEAREQDPQPAPAATCKSVHASMVEERVTVGCKPGHDFCFLGEVTGNHGLRGATYFKGDSSGSRPPASPDFLPYSGIFEYHTSGGVLITRETGVTNTSQGKPESGAVTAFQKITDATGELSGTTGYLFVSGFSRGGRVETNVTGEICRPAEQ